MNHSILDFIQLDSSTLVDEASKVFSDEEGKGRVLQLVTDATHSGKIINNRVYPGSAVKWGAKTFFKNDAKDGAKFDKPFLLNHDRSSDPIGRVKDAVYHPTVTGDRWAKDYATPSDEGSGFLRTTSEISDQDAIEKFLDGRYQTVSQSAISDAMYCSHCSDKKGELVPLWSSWTDRNDNSMECRHYPGDTVDGVEMYLITGNLTYRELSQVTVPADDAGIHVSMSMLKDELADKNSLIGMMGDKLKDISILKTPVYASILDSKGNSVRSLNIKDYVTTKVISIPTKQPIVEIKDNSSDAENTTVSTTDFAEARILNHFNKYFGLELSNDEDTKVRLLDSCKLSKEQSEVVTKGFFIHTDLPFRVVDEATVDASFKLARRLFKDTTERSNFLSQIEKQAKDEQVTYSTQGKNTMNEEQSKALLASLDAEKAKTLKAVDDLAALQTKYDALNKIVADSEIEVLIKARQEVGHSDCAGFDKMSVEDKAKIVAKYADMSNELRGHILAEAKDMLAKGFTLNTLDGQETPNPLEVAPTAPANKPTEAFKDTAVVTSAIASKTSLL